MRTSALILLLSLTASAQGRFERLCGRSDSGRSDRGFDCGGAYLEAFSASGAGTNGVCSTTPPIGFNFGAPVALTFTRASVATCTKTAAGGMAQTGIADGDLVSLATDVVRVEYDSAGVLGPRTEKAGTNIAIKARLPCNAAYADVGTPSCTAAATTGPWGTTTMSSITDDSGAAFEGRSQAIADVSQTIHTAYAYVKGGTATSATITMVGTGNSAGDCTGTVTALSLTSSKILKCTGAAYGAGLTAVTVTVKVGTVVGDQGVLYWEGLDVKPSMDHVTSFVDTDTIALTRAADAPSFVLPAFTVTAPWCFGANVELPSAIPTNARLAGTFGPAGLGTYAFDSYASGGTWNVDSTQVTPNLYDTTRAVTASAVNRAATYHDGTLFNGCINGTCGAGVSRAWTNIANVTTYRLGMYDTTNGVVDGIVTRIKFSNADAVSCR